MSTLPPLSFFPPLNRPPPSSYWPVRGSTSHQQHKHAASATHPSKFLAAEIESLSDEETQFENAHLRIRNWGTKDIRPAGRVTTWDEDEDDAAGVVDESSPAINGSNPNQGFSPAETEVAPTHANYLGGPQHGTDSDEEQSGVSPVRDLDEEVEEYQERSFVNNAYESESEESNDGLGGGNQSSDSN